jgi:hypothetical protein
MKNWNRTRKNNKLIFKGESIMHTDNKIKLLYLYEEAQECKGTVYQEVSNPEEDVDGISTNFSVCDLSDCPEDAIIGRSLFDAKDYLRAIRTGMKLAKYGYEDVDFADVRG